MNRRPEARGTRIARIVRRAAPVLLALLSSCVPTQLAIYSRPGGAEVYLDDRLLARTVDEATPITLEVRMGRYGVRVLKDGYYPWSRTIDAKPYSVTPVLADLVPLEQPRPYVPIGSVELRVSPAGSRVFLDDRELTNVPAEANERFVIGDLTPGPHTIRVQRQGYESREERFEIYSNLASTVAVNLSPLTPYYAYASNDDLLREAAVKAVRGVAHLPGMRSTKTIGLVNLDGTWSSSPELNALEPLIEDVLVAELARNGRGVVEREDHLLVRLAQESARSDSFTLEVLTTHGGPDRPFLYDARLKSSADAVALLATDTAGRARQIVVRNRVEEPRAHLKSADQILGYRIVERTMRVDADEAGSSGEPMVRREAIIRLFVRLLDARTGVVEWAERFEASVVDRVPRRVYRWLEHPPSRAYAYEAKTETRTPAKEGNESAPPVESFTEEDLQRVGDRDILFWYWRNMGEAYLRADRYDDAARHLREAAELRPDDYETRMLYAEALLRNGNLDEAGREYIQAMRGLQ